MLSKDMAIVLQTSKRRGIDNFQDADTPELHRKWFKALSRLHPNAIQRTEPSALFNCHGLTFASRRTKVLDSRNISRVITDDCWNEIDLQKILPGDIVIYYDDSGDANHSGIIVQYSSETLVPLVCSKWGYAGEYLHRVNDVPQFYGPIMKFFRCCL